MWMLINEAQIYLRVDHPHIAKCVVGQTSALTFDVMTHNVVPMSATNRLIEVWEDATHVHFVMEYCAGKRRIVRVMMPENFLSQEECYTIACAQENASPNKKVEYL